MNEGEIVDTTATSAITEAPIDVHTNARFGLYCHTQHIRCAMQVDLRLFRSAAFVW